MAEGERTERYDADDEVETVSVGLIGAGRRMTPLLSRMLEYDYIDVRIVVDPNRAAPGLIIAESLGVPTSGDLDDLLCILRQLDFVFCVSEEPGMRDALIDYFQRSNNRHTVLFNELATRFIMSLTKDARELMQLVPSHPVHRIGEGE